VSLGVPDPEPNEENYARVIEQIAGIDVPLRAQYIRTLILELSRIASHLFGFGGHAATIGLYTVPNWSFADRDRVIELFEEHQKTLDQRRLSCLALLSIL
jgi:NADH-quinone oxidoreductase subunit D